LVNNLPGVTISITQIAGNFFGRIGLDDGLQKGKNKNHDNKPGILEQCGIYIEFGMAKQAVYIIINTMLNDLWQP
jgi:hypothetical protein